VIVRRPSRVRPAAFLLLAAIAFTTLHQHPQHHGPDAEKTSTCAAAAWHAGAVLHGDGGPRITLALIELPAPAAAMFAPSSPRALRPWSSRAPPRDA